MPWLVDEKKVLSGFDFQSIKDHPEGYHETENQHDDLGEAREFVHESAAKQRAKPVHQALTSS